MKSGGRTEGEGGKGVCRLAVTSCSLICEMKHLAQAATATRTSDESESPPQQNRTEMSFESCMRHKREGRGQAQGCSGAKSLNRFPNELPLNRLSLSLSQPHPSHSTCSSLYPVGFLSSGSDLPLASGLLNKCPRLGNCGKASRWNICHNN